MVDIRKGDKPYWLVFYSDDLLDDDGYSFDQEPGQNEASFQVFESEEAAHSWAKENVNDGCWEHCVIVRATTLGIFSKFAVFTPAEGATVQKDHRPERTGKRKLALGDVE